MPRKKKRYIIRNEIEKFWTGTGWSSEYPDAIICEGAEALRNAIFRAQCKAVRVFKQSVD